MSEILVTDPATFPAAFDHALNTADLDWLLKLYEPQASIHASDGSVGKGTDALRQEMEKLISAKAQLHNQLRHVFQSGETALIVVDWTLELNTPDGKRFKSQGTAANVIRQSPGAGMAHADRKPPRDCMNTSSGGHAGRKKR